MSRAWVLLLLWWVASPAYAAEIEALWAPDWAGAWAPVKTTGEAWVERGGETLPVAVGMTLAPDDRLVTQQARVRLRLDEDHVATAYEGSAMVLREWTYVDQQLGRLVYEVRDLFRVQYARTEVLVEGTTFAVDGSADGSGQVAVLEGRVRVRNDDGEVVLDRGDVAVLSAAGAPVAMAAARSVLKTWRERPDGSYTPLEIGLRAGLGYGDSLAVQSPGVQLRTELYGRFELRGPLSLAGSIGLLNSTTTSRFPISLGPELALGPVALRASATAVTGACVACSDGDVEPMVRPGGLGAVAFRPQVGRWRPELQLSMGWAWGPFVDATVGVARRL